MIDFYDSEDTHNDHDHDERPSSSSSSSPRQSLGSRVRRLFSRRDKHKQRQHRSKPRSMSVVEPYTICLNFPRRRSDMRTESIASVSKSRRGKGSSFKRRGSHTVVSHKRAVMPMTASASAGDLCSALTLDTTPPSSNRNPGYGGNLDASRHRSCGAMRGFHSAPTSPMNTNTSVSYVDPVAIQAEATSSYASSSASNSPHASSRSSGSIYGANEDVRRKNSVATLQSRGSTCSTATRDTVKFNDNESFIWLANVVSADIEYSVNETAQIFEHSNAVDWRTDVVPPVEETLEDLSKRFFLPNMHESTRGIYVNM